MLVYPHRTGPCHVTTMTTSFLVTVKSLLPLFILVVCVAQVSTLPLVGPPGQNEESNKKVIDDFRKEVEKHNSMSFIIRVNGKDEVHQDTNRYTKRILTVGVKAHYSTLYFGYGDREKWVNYYKRYYDLYAKWQLIPPLEFDSTNFEATLSKMDREFYDTKCPLYMYYQDIRKEIKDSENVISYLPKVSDDKQMGQLAQYVVPLAEDIFSTYDKAINYITLQHQLHCTNEDSIVQQYHSYYVEVWWNSVNRISNAQVNPNDWNNWERYMATGCPFPSDLKKLVDSLWNKGKTLELNNFGRQVPMPLEVNSRLQTYLPMVKGMKTNSELVNQLVLNFKAYLGGAREEHDDNLWAGYQKKLIVQQTIIRVMLEDFTKSTEFLDKEKEKFRAWRDKFPTTPIPKAIVDIVARALYRSAAFQEAPNAKGVTMLQVALMFLFEKHYVQFEPPDKSKITDEHFKDNEVTIPEKLKMFSADLLISDKLHYSKVMDAIVGRISHFQNGIELTNAFPNKKTWAELVLTIVPELMSLTPPVSGQTVPRPNSNGGSEPSTGQIVPPNNQKVPPANGPQNVDPNDQKVPPANGSQKVDPNDQKVPPVNGPQKVDPSDAQLTPVPQGNNNNQVNGNQSNHQERWCGRAVKWINQNKCYIVTRVSIIGLVSAAAYTIYWFMSGSPTTSTTISSISTSPVSPRDLSNPYVWLIVIIIGATLIVGLVFYLTCHKKGKRNHGGKNTTCKNTTKKASKVTSTISTIGSSLVNTPSSIRPSSSLGGVSSVRSRGSATPTSQTSNISAKSPSRQVSLDRKAQSSAIHSSASKPTTPTTLLASSHKRKEPSLALNPSATSSTADGSSLSVLSAPGSPSKVENSTLFTSSVALSSIHTSPDSSIKGSPARKNFPVLSRAKSPPGKAQSPTDKGAKKKDPKK